MFVLHSFMGPAVKLLGQVQLNAFEEPNIENIYTILLVAFFLSINDFFYQALYFKKNTFSICDFFTVFILTKTN